MTSSAPKRANRELVKAQGEVKKLEHRLANIKLSRKRQALRRKQRRLNNELIRHFGRVVETVLGRHN